MGIRAEVKIDSPPGCPIALVTETSGGTCNSVAKTSATGPDGSITEEFVVDADADVESIECGDVEELFSYGSKRTYRLSRPAKGCACERIEQLDCPVTDVYARSGTLFVTFHTADMGQLKRVLTELRDHWTGVTVKRLLHATEEGFDNDLVLLDRAVLTDRQREVLETAHDLGFFEHGQGANAGEVAAALDINTSTFSEHIRAAQRKLLRTILDD